MNANYELIAGYCRVYWGSHGCRFPYGHHLIPGNNQYCQCVCADDSDPQDSGNVSSYPYYGPETQFYGEDAQEVWGRSKFLILE